MREYLRVLLLPVNIVVVENGGNHDRLSGLPELIVSDVVMPRKDGYEKLCKTIKTSADWGRIPIILLTARTIWTAVSKDWIIGADAYDG